MATNVDDPTIPLDCDAFGAFGATTDACAPVINTGPLRYMLTSQAPWTVFPPTVTEYTTRLALLDTDPLAMREVIIEGSMAPVDPKVVRYDFRDIAVVADREITLTMKDTGAANYEAARTANVGFKTRAWFLNQDRTLGYGGKNGVGDDSASLLLGNNIPTGEEDAHTITGRLKYRSKFDPKRFVSII